LAEILHVETSALVSLGDGDDEAEVGFGEGGFGAEGATDLFFDLGDGHSRFDGVGPFLVGWWPQQLSLQLLPNLLPLDQNLNLPRQYNLLILLQQIMIPHSLHIILHRVKSGFTDIGTDAPSLNFEFLGLELSSGGTGCGAFGGFIVVDGGL